ncbi:hypothetical protein TNCV_3928351 [Trichonephila clavipes]|nr:hypothetical protein TNCV_3928351 [Trichonephila clavipes]
MTSHNHLDNSLRWRATVAGLKLDSLKRRWLDGYKWSKSDLLVIESIPNKLNCHQKRRNVPDKVILGKSSPEEKTELSFIPPT